LAKCQLRGIDLGSDDTYVPQAFGERGAGTTSHGRVARCFMTGKDSIYTKAVTDAVIRSPISGVDLYHADLTDTVLAHANLASSNLTWAHLVKTDLSDADLRCSRLWFADFMEANLSNSRFDGATTGWTKFSRVDLSRASGLENIVHIGPSMVGFDTIEHSGGAVPKQFLQGAGLSDKMIRAQLSLSRAAFYSCFISYAHEDRQFARRLHGVLQSQGVRCWLDEKDILPGDNIYDQVERGIRSADKVLLCCSQSSLNSWWVDGEIATAFAKEQRLVNDARRETTVLIPLNLDGYLLSGKWRSGKSAQVLQRLAADFTGRNLDDASFEAACESVVDALRKSKAKRRRLPG